MDAANLVDEATLENLEAVLEETLWRYEPTRTAAHPIQYRVRPDRIVELRGSVRSQLIKDTVKGIVREIPGVEGVENHIVSDPEVEIAVAQRLATDPQLKTIPPGAIQIRSHYGAVTLLGRLTGGIPREAVIEAVRSVPGVRHILDRLME